MLKRTIWYYVLGVAAVLRWRWIIRRLMCKRIATYSTEGKIKNFYVYEFFNADGQEKAESD